MPNNSKLFFDTATFVKIKAHSGEAIFKSKEDDKTTIAQWGVYKATDSIKATLLVNGFMLVDEDIENYKDKIIGTVVLY